jgi:hypothetical protein
MADVTDRETVWSKIGPGALLKALKEYISYKIDSIDEDLNIHTNLFQQMSGYFASIAFLTTLYGISYIDDPSTYIVIATSLLAFSTFLTIDFFQKYEKHQLLHLVNRSGAKYPSLRAERVINRDVPVLFVWEPSISSTVFFTWCNPLAVAIALIANTGGIKSTPRMCLFGVALMLGLQIRALLGKYNKKIEDKKLIFEEGMFINSQFYEKNYVLASPDTRAANSQSSPTEFLNASTSSASNNSGMRISNSGISPTKSIVNAKDNVISEYGTNYSFMNRKPTISNSYGTSQADVSPPRRESPVRSAPSSNPSSRHSSMEFPSSSGLFSLMDNPTRPSFYGHGNQNGNSNGNVYGLANAPPYTPHIGMNGSHDTHMMEQDQQQPTRRTTFGLDQDPPTSSLYDF